MFCLKIYVRQSIKSASAITTKFCKRLNGMMLNWQEPTAATIYVLAWIYTEKQTTQILKKLLFKGVLTKKNIDTDNTFHY